MILIERKETEREREKELFKFFARTCTFETDHIRLIRNLPALVFELFDLTLRILQHSTLLTSTRSTPLIFHYFYVLLLVGNNALATALLHTISQDYTVLDYKTHLEAQEFPPDSLRPRLTSLFSLKKKRKNFSSDYITN